MYKTFKENNEEYFKGFVHIQKIVKRDFIIEQKRHTRYVVMTNGFRYCEYSTIPPRKNYDKYSDENKKKRYAYTKIAVPLIAQTKKQVNTFLRENGNTIEKIEKIHSPIYRDNDAWNELPNETELKYIDINHCYWRIAYLKGYISETFYKNTLKSKKSKLFRNIALASLIAGRKRTYYIRGEENHEIEENTEIYKTIYANIRYSASNFLGEIAGKIKGYCYNYRVDGMLVHPDYVDFVAQEFAKHNFSYTISDCSKVSDTHFFNGKTEKHF